MAPAGAAGTGEGLSNRSSNLAAQGPGGARPPCSPCSQALGKSLRSSGPRIPLANGREGTQLPGLVCGECYGRKRLLLLP